MMQRRELFSSLASSLKGKKQGSDAVVIRPPYYINENDFLNCAECEGFCVESCEENVISLYDDKSPYLDFTKGGCTYCDKCADACGFDVLKIEYKRKINVKINIDVLKCISWQNTICFSCKDVCLDNAINYLGLFRPEIDQEKCTNCGFCVKVCPTNAIKVE